jgi:hypothetical protein
MTQNATTSNVVQNPLEAALADSLGKLETALLTPVISGELASWVRASQQPAQQAQQDLQKYVAAVLHQEYNEIAKSDSELLERVQQMYKEEESLTEEFAHFLKDLDNLAQRAELDNRDEVKMAEHHTRVVNRGNELILHIKRLQVAAATWLSEAVYRDRGPVD